MQLVAGGYLAAGVPALLVSGAVPLFSSFWSKRRKKHKHHSEGSKKKHSRWDICDSLDLCDCGCDCD
jgi:hypothetical protein